MELGADGARPNARHRTQNNRFSLRKCPAWSYLRRNLIPDPTTDEERMRKLMLSMLLGLTLWGSAANAGQMEPAAPILRRLRYPPPARWTRASRCLLHCDATTPQR